MAPRLALLQVILSPLADDALATTRLGITLRGFRRLKQLLVDSLSEEGFETFSTADVMVGWVRPSTAAGRKRLLESREHLPAADIRPPHYFISHACELLAAQELCGSAHESSSHPAPQHPQHPQHPAPSTPGRCLNAQPSYGVPDTMLQ